MIHIYLIVFLLFFYQLSNMMTDSANEEPNYLVEKMSQLNFMTSGRRFEVNE